MIQRNPNPEPLSGKKTYIVAAAMLAYAFGGMFLGYVETSEGIPLVMEAGAIIALRLGIKKAEL